MSLTDPNKWSEYDTYYIFEAEQRSEDWLKVHRGRCSGSTIGACVGHSSFATPEEQARYIAEVEVKQFTEKQRANMNYGTNMEPVARKWYESSRKYRVRELGMAIPKWNSYLGVSVDGMVEGQEGIIEIKCVQRMYWPLINYCKNPKSGYDHIWKTHYDQMILGMAILNKKWCDYIVFCPKEAQVFVQRIPFDSKYWSQLYKDLQSFIDTELKPYKIEPIVPENYPKK